MFVEILRPFTGDRPLRVGEIVDASEWLLVDRLIDQRYVREARVPDETPAPVRARARRMPKE